MLREVETLVNIMQTIMSIYVNRFRKVGCKHKQQNTYFVVNTYIEDSD